MGIQITIKAADMVAAGWTEEVETESYFDQDEVEQFYDSSIWIKGDRVLHSYCPGCFCADCNDWGSNKALFAELGLFDIPHVLG